MAGKYGNALSFDAADDVVSVGRDVIGTGASTISAWLYLGGYGEGGYGMISTNGPVTLFLAGWDSLLAFSGDNFAHQTISASNSVPLNQWVFVAVTRTSSGSANFWVNGVRSGTADQASGTPVAGSGLMIGSGFDGDDTIDGRRGTFHGIDPSAKGTDHA